MSRRSSGYRKLRERLADEHRWHRSYHDACNQCVGLLGKLRLAWIEMVPQPIYPKVDLTLEYPAGWEKQVWPHYDCERAESYLLGAMSLGG